MQSLEVQHMPAAQIREPLVVVVVLNYNTFEWTDRCIAALETLSYSNWRLLVVDNASTDGSYACLMATHPTVGYLKAPHNLGFAGGCNLGIRRALELNADYVWLLNSDTTCEPRALRAMVSRAESSNDIGAVGCLVFEMDAPDVIQCWGGGRYDLWTGWGNVMKGPARLDYLTGTSMLVRAAALRETGLLDDRFFFYFEDTEFGYRLRRGGWTLAVAPDARIWHATSQSVGPGSSRQGELWARSMVRFMRLHAPVPVVPAILALLGKLILDLSRSRWRTARGLLKGWCQGWFA
jgi:GT2 family glycosyltransferase